MGKILVYVFHQYIQSTEVFHILPQILQAFVWFHFNFEVNVDFFGPKHFEIEWQTLYITELIVHIATLNELVAMFRDPVFFR